MSVGGKVVDVVRAEGRVWVNTRDQSKTVCAIYIERNQTSERIQPGDSLWWQGPWAMWTPEDALRSSDGGKSGKDFDIRIPRASYSGVSAPEAK